MAHDVGVERVDAVGDRGRPAGPVDRPVVGVGDERDAQAVQPAAQPGDGDVDAAGPRHPHRLDVAPPEQHHHDGDDRRGHDAGPGRVGDAADEQRQPQQLADTDQTNSTQTTPSRVSPVAAAQSRCLRPWPSTIVTGSATNAAANTTVPRTTTTVGQCVPADSSVHHGTPNSSSMIANTTAKRRHLRRDRGWAAASTCAAGVSDIGELPRSLVPSGLSTVPRAGRWTS